MPDRAWYSLDDDLEEAEAAGAAEAAVRKLPAQISRLKGMVEVARAVLKPDEEPEGAEPRS